MPPDPQRRFARSVEREPVPKCSYRKKPPGARDVELGCIGGDIGLASADVVPGRLSKQRGSAGRRLLGKSMPGGSSGAKGPNGCGKPGSEVVWGAT